jgi:hypothetical protein
MIIYKGHQPKNQSIEKSRTKKIFLDKRVWRDSRDNWVSFESGPKLKVMLRREIFTGGVSLVSPTSINN